MRSRIGRTLLFMLPLALLAQTAMTNEDVIRLARTGASEAAQVEAIRTASAQAFRITPEEQPALAEAGVPKPVITAMVERKMRDAAMSSYRGEPLAGEWKQRRGFAMNGDFALPRGGSELLMRVGGSTFQNRLYGRSYEWYAAAGAAVGITRYVAGIGEYSYSQLTGDSFLRITQGRMKMQDLIAGARISTPTRASAYLMAGGGYARYDVEVTTLGVFTGTATQSGPAFALGCGINIAVRRGFGVQWDLRFVKPTDFIWRTRSSFGVFVRF